MPDVLILELNAARTSRNPQDSRYHTPTTGTISSSPAFYGQTVLWAAAIHSDLPDAGGLVWTSNQCDPDDACLFFGDRVQESDFSAIRSRDDGSDKSFVTDVRTEGRLRGITLTI